MTEFHEILREIDERDLELLERQARGLPYRSGQVPRGWQIERDYLNAISESRSAPFND